MYIPDVWIYMKLSRKKIKKWGNSVSHFNPFRPTSYPILFIVCIIFSIASLYIYHISIISGVDRYLLYPHLPKFYIYAYTVIYHTLFALCREFHYILVGIFFAYTIQTMNSKKHACFCLNPTLHTLWLSMISKSMQSHFVLSYITLFIFNIIYNISLKTKQCYNHNQANSRNRYYIQFFFFIFFISC